MQNYGQPQDYQRPGSTASFAGHQAAPPPPLPPRQGYGDAGYQYAASQPQGQWGAPNQTSGPWAQPQQQATGGYNPGTYGYIGGQQTSVMQPAYAPQQHDHPPPPPPKPHGFAAAVQQQQQQQQQQQYQHNTQTWSQQPPQNTGSIPQQSYSNAAPPPPSATPGGSYFPPPQGGRPGSIYGANQVDSYASTPTPVSQQPSTVVSPNEQQPAYIPPSLSGQGVQAYMPENTNPAPGVYVPPPPDVPAWQQAQHAPLQGGLKKFTYTKPIVDPSFYAQGHQSIQQLQSQQPSQPQPQYGQPMQDQYPPSGQMSQQAQPSPSQTPFQHQYGQFGPPAQSQPQPFSQPVQWQGQFQQQSQYSQAPQDQQTQQSPHYSQQQHHWPPPQPADQGFGQQDTQAPYQSGQPAQQQQWEPGHQTQGPLSEQQYPQVREQGIQAPKPLSRTDTASSTFFNQPSPQSQPVSPVNNRQSVSFASKHQIGPGRTGSVSSIALANLHAQRADNRTSSPKPAPPKLPTPPPPRDDKSRFSVLGSGGPSDWEHFGAGDEVDDEHIFGAKEKQAKTESVQVDSVELPAHVPSPPSTHGWPSPAVQPTPLDPSNREETYMPTPPSVSASSATRPPSQSPQQSFVVEDAAIAPLNTSSRPTSISQPPSAQQAFVMENLQAEIEKLKADVVSAKAHGANEKHVLQGQIELMKLTAEQARINAGGSVSEKEKTDLHAEIEKLKADIETAKAHAASEKQLLQGQIELMKLTVEQVRTNADALVKEKDITIERITEDVEGKEHNIQERDITIADLRCQLEAEKAKESPKPTPADLVPDLDPWYVGSLERYITMLRGEASESQVEDKIKTFKAFLKAESGIRGIEYYEAPPPAPVAEALSSRQPTQPVLSRGTSEASSRPHDLNVQTLQEAPTEDDYDFSPGGRPVLRRRATLTSSDGVPLQQHFDSSEQSTTILTPTSSIDDDWNKTPVQSPLEEQPQPQYKAYVPPASTSSNPTSMAHRQAASFSNAATVVSPSGPSKGHDEIFFGAHGSERSNLARRQNSSDSTVADIPIPAPLSFAAHRVTSTAPLSTKDPANTLAGLLPTQIAPAGPSHSIEALRVRSVNIKADIDNIEGLTKTWEKSTSLIRRKNDDARRQRQEENEEHNDDLFNSNEISYAEMKRLEDEFKQKEGELKAQEGSKEYESYVGAVFDTVYESLQTDIKALMDLYTDAKNLLHSSVSGVKSLEGSDAASTKECLELFKELHEKIEKRHERVAQAIAERDRRYKRTETQPLYAAGNIAQMKSVEKHFENAEKQAALRAKREKADRIGELVDIVEETVVAAVGLEQGEIDRIIAAIEELEDGRGDADLLARAHICLTLLRSSSKALLSLFNALEIELNNSDIDAEIAQVKAGNDEPGHLQELENEKAGGVKKIIAEFERRIRVLEQDKEEVEKLIERKRERGVMSLHKEHDRKLNTALEEAKRRNGDL